MRLTAREVRVDGAPVFAIPADGSLGEPEIPAVVAALASRCASGSAHIAVDGDVRYPTLFPVTMSVRAAGCKSFDLQLVDGPTIPHPARYPGRTTELPADAPPLGGALGLTLVVGRDSLSLSSETRELSLVLHRASDLTKALAELSTLCWPKATRTLEDKQIFVVAQRDVDMARLVPILNATRTGRDGRELFPHHVFLPPHRAPNVEPERRAANDPPSSPGAVVIESMPNGATVLDAASRVRGRTPLVLSLDRTTLPVTFRVAHDRYAPASVTIAPDSTTPMRVRLRPLASTVTGCPPRRR